MKFWSVQSKEVLDIINNKGEYRPQVTESRFIASNPDLFDLYQTMVNIYNNINKTNYNGLIYTFFAEDYNTRQPLYFENIQQFQDIIEARKQSIKSLWHQLLERDSYILELTYSGTFNPLFIDINDFQFLIPPIQYLYPYNSKDIRRIVNDLSVGRLPYPIFPSGLIQAHVPYIRKENIVNIYPMFEI